MKVLYKMIKDNENRPNKEILVNVRASLPESIHAKLMMDKYQNKKTDGTRYSIEEIFTIRVIDSLTNNPDFNKINLEGNNNAA